jgi:hypothetical protein
LDASGNVFVTGRSVGVAGGHDYATIKYSSTGAPLWTNRYSGPANYSDIANAVAVDGSGDVVVTGESSIGGSGYDYATVKYSRAGVPLWTNRYNGAASRDDSAKAVAVDSSGNVYVTGYSLSGVTSDYATIKYSGAGIPLWTNRFSGPGNSDDAARAIAVDSSGNLVVTGDSGGDYATIKYSNEGVPLWTNHYNGPGNSSDYATAIAVDADSNVVVTGNSSGINGWPDYDYATIKYSSAGVPLWTNRYRGLGNIADYAWAVAMDGSGNVFVTGGSRNGSSYDYATIKYSSAGVPLLKIARTTANTLAISWPSPATDFTLQQNTNVATTNWTPVGETPTDDGTTKRVILNPPPANAFYRLFHP